MTVEEQSMILANEFGPKSWRPGLGFLRASSRNPMNAREPHEGARQRRPTHHPMEAHHPMDAVNSEPRANCTWCSASNAGRTVAAVPAIVGHVNEPMENPVLLVEALNDVFCEKGIAPFVEQVDGMRHEVRKLQKSVFPRWGEVRCVTQIVQDAPLRAQISKPANPNLRALLIVTLCKQQQATLFVVVLVGAPGEERIEALADLLRGTLHGVFAVEGRRLLDSGCEQLDSRIIRERDGLREVLQNEVLNCWFDATPKSLAGANVRSVKVDRRLSRKMLVLNPVYVPGEKERNALENRDTPDDEVLVSGIVRIPRFVQIQKIHGMRPVQRKGG